LSADIDLVFSMTVGAFSTVIENTRQKRPSISHIAN